jgi:TPR repeat protein
MKRWILAAVTCSVLWGGDFSQAINDYEAGAYIKAFNTFFTLAKEENPQAQFNVALMYEKGRGVRQDTAEAMRWYEKAAQNGYAPAAYNLAVLLEHTGDAHAKEKARYWYEKAVEGGVKEAYNNLARLFFEGKGVPQDIKRAETLLKEGAQKGSAEAMYNLGFLYLEGARGVEQDKLKAYEYLLKARKNGIKQAEPLLEKLCKESPWACQAGGA